MFKTSRQTLSFPLDPTYYEGKHQHDVFPTRFTSKLSNNNLWRRVTGVNIESLWILTTTCQH